MRTADLLAWSLLTLAACHESSSEAPGPSPSASAAPAASASASASASTGRVVDAGPVFDYATATPILGKSVGHTSVVFKLKLQGGLEAAWKPRSHRGNTRYRGEIAAYRLAISLGLHNVPTAIPRSFPLATLQTAMGEKTADGNGARELLDKEVIAESDGQVTGALIPWIPKLEMLALESEEWRHRYSAWLAPDARPPEDAPSEGDGGGADRPGLGVGLRGRTLAPQISSMIAFDYLTGNWDRWSGAQIGIDRATGTLLYLDNDGAFYDPPPAGPLAAQLARLNAVGHFSRSFVGAVRAFEPSTAKIALGDDGRGVAILTPNMLKQLDERRKHLLEIIDAKIAAKGEASVLSFP